MQMLKKLNRHSLWLQRILPVVLAVVAAFISRYQLELSDQTSADFLSGQWPVYAPMNALTAFCLTLILFAVIGRWWLATGLSGAVFSLIALTNYYTRTLHGSVLMPQDVLNLGTATKVLGNYKLQISSTVFFIVLWVVPLAAIVLLQHWLTRDLPPHSLWRWRGVRVVVCAALVFSVFYAGYFSATPLLPITHDFWSLEEIYKEYGYLAGTVSATTLLQDPILQPDNYSDENAQKAAAMVTGTAETAESQEYPDIVVVLSESFYDLSLVTDLQTDTEVFPVLNSLDNAVKGHTVVAEVGGGTNCSEYELLTSNSVSLMPSTTPFNWLNLYGANSLVNYLENLGYTTMAAHPYAQGNYRRGSGWQALGFDQTYFDDSFAHLKTYYGDRRFQMDSATYQDFESFYEAMPEDQPRFAFLVSIQSHGDYDTNDPSVDIVHAATDYGEYDEPVNEYLSCMRLSDEAIGELCDYFTNLYETTGRKVVLAFTGDHSPIMIYDLADQDRYQSNVLNLLERCPPFFIWANYPLENTDMATSTTDPLNRMDMVMLAPTILQQAGLPLSPYYQYLLEMKSITPAVTSMADYLASDGQIYKFGENANADDWVHGYFHLEYNNIGAHANRDQSLFEPR